MMNWITREEVGYFCKDIASRCSLDLEIILGK